MLVEAFDRPDQKAMLMQYGGSCPLVAASGLAGYGSKVNRLEFESENRVYGGEI